jgi:Ca2+-binding RTX toxin-like protein
MTGWRDTGNDTMTGGADNDTYIVDSTDDSIIEPSNGGIDTHIVTNGGDTVVEVPGGETDTIMLRHVMDIVMENAGGGIDTLANNVENLTFIATDNFVGAGNVRSNIVTDAAGADTLTRVAGADVFILAAGDANSDVIGQFSHVNGDRISFTGYGTGAALGARTFAGGVTSYIV